MSLLHFSSLLIADVGISLGDEGKGRLVPEIVEELRSTKRPVTVVMKVNGGANAGHTAAGVKLNLLPSGVVEREIPHLAIGSGVVADPRKILWEAPLERKGYSVLDSPRRRAHDDFGPDAPPARPRGGGLSRERPRGGLARLHRPRDLGRL